MTIEGICIGVIIAIVGLGLGVLIAEICYPKNEKRNKNTF